MTLVVVSLYDIMANDFSKGKVWRIIVSQAIPLIIAQLVQLLYNVVDRIYIGHLPGAHSMALTGIGIVFPITTLIAAFTNLYGTGGTPLFSIARGEKEDERAAKIMGNTFTLLILTSIILMVLCFCFSKPVLYLLGASKDTYIYADSYLKIYLFGTTFSMISVGMNGFINAQGFPKIGMVTTVIGALLNLLLDPVFIFLFKMGVSGAALATVISQMVSAIWVVWFLCGKKALFRLEKRSLKLNVRLVAEIIKLGFAGFVVQGTNCMVQSVCNIMLKMYGGYIYVGVITIINSIRDVANLPVHGLTSGAQPVLGFNYGAKKYDRVRYGIRFMGIISIIYTFIFWGIVLLVPSFFIRIFTSNADLITVGIPAIKIYFFGFFFMAFQFTGQSTFTSLGMSKHAVFFSLLRKAIIVVPLTILLPMMGFGVKGVFLAEPISNLIGGSACFTTMYFTVYRKMVRNMSK